MLATFIILQIVNVIGSTIRSLTTIKAGKTVASLVSALYYGYYTIVIIYTMCDLSLWAKVVVTAVTNFIGVFMVKMVEEKLRKDRTWEIRATVKKSKLTAMDSALTRKGIPHNYIEVGSNVIFNCYSETQGESLIIKKIIEENNAKYFASESKIL